MKRLSPVLFLAVLLGFGFWVWTAWRASPQEIIKKRITELARLVSFAPNEGEISRLARVKKLGLFFSEDVQVMLDMVGFEPQTFNRREEVEQVAMASPRLGNGVTLKFLDMNIQLGNLNQAALVDLTLEGKINGENDLIAQELKFTMQKINGDWLITRVETVKPLKP